MFKFLKNIKLTKRCPKCGMLWEFHKEKCGPSYEGLFLLATRVYEDTRELSTDDYLSEKLPLLGAKANHLMGRYLRKYWVVKN